MKSNPIGEKRSYMGLEAMIADGVKFFWDPVKQHASYLCCYSRNVIELNTSLDQLRPKITDVGTEVEAAVRRGEVIKEVVKEWIEDADRILADGQRMVERAEDTQCLGGLCCDCLLQYRLGKEVAGKIADINNLVQRENEVSGHFHAFSSTVASKDAVLEAMKDDKIYIIGIYGMGGIGKTTLMKEVGKIVEEEKLFNKVVMVTVSQNQDINKIQKEIVDQLGFEFEDDDSRRAGDDSQRAGSLPCTLKEMKVLIILDDLWEKLELSKVGIPLLKNDHGCKIVITTRRSRVCDHMDCNKKMHMEVLSENDSWELFKLKAGDVVEHRRVAKEVCRECGGLPLAIVTVGSTLRGEDEMIWENALVKFKKAAPSRIENMESKVFRVIKWSYDFLGSAEDKLGFLFCCTFPEDYDIREELFTMYAFGEGFLKCGEDPIDTWQEACSEVHRLFVKLKASCLLLEGNKKGTVKMHDVVRDVAIQIAQKDEEFLIKPRAGLTGWPDVQHKLLDKCKRISLMGNEIRTLGGQPGCAKLKTLILRENESLESISDEFFTAMKDLVVLDLSYTHISSLPESLAFLTNLRVLSLSGSPIKALPEEMGQLTGLRCLDLEGTKYLQEMEVGTVLPLLSRMTRLEHLNMKRSFNRWKLATLTELASFPCLTSLQVDVLDGQLTLEDLTFTSMRNLTRFNITLGSFNEEDEDLKIIPGVNRRLTITDPIQFSLREKYIDFPFATWVKVLSRESQQLELFGCDGLTTVAELLHVDDERYGGGGSGFKCLKYLDISCCSELESLTIAAVDGGAGAGSSRSTVEGLFPVLEKLFLCSLPKLMELCRGPPPDGCFRNLKRLEIDSCDSLSHVFSWRLVAQGGLQQLEELNIHNCDTMEVVITRGGALPSSPTTTATTVVRGDHENKTRMTGFPQLKTLLLNSLPMLTDFCADNDTGGEEGSDSTLTTFDWPALKYFQVRHCPNLKKLPLAGGP